MVVVVEVDVVEEVVDVVVTPEHPEPEQRELHSASVEPQLGAFL